MAKSKAVAAAVTAMFAVGSMVVFKGYKEDVPEADRLLQDDEQYEIADVNEKEGSLGVIAPNPDFNPKKKVSDTNQETVVVDVFFEEVEAVDGEGGEDGEGVEEADGTVEEKPARTSRAAPEKAAAKPAAKAATKPAAKAATKPAAKAAAKPAAKGKAVTKTKEAAEPVDESEALPALEDEDADIVELIDGADLIELAGELVDDAEALNYKLGGVLYHLRLGKSYQDVDKKKYGVKGGWQLFLEENLPGLGYRKAMNLIDIYYKVNKFGIDPVKVQEVGWSKFAKIVQVMDEDNANDLVELAENSTVATLSDEIKSSYSTAPGTGSSGEKRKKIVFKFRLWEDQAVAVEEIINSTAKAMNLKEVSDAFEHIVMEWAAEHGVEQAAPAKASAKPAAKAATPAKAAPKARARA